MLATCQQHVGKMLKCCGFSKNCVVSRHYVQHRDKICLLNLCRCLCKTEILRKTSKNLLEVWFNSYMKNCICKLRTSLLLIPKLKFKEATWSLTPKIASQLHHICRHACNSPHLPLAPPLILFLLHFSFFAKMKLIKKIWGDP